MERTLDNVLRSSLSTGVYGTDFGESFRAGFKADIVYGFEAAAGIGLGEILYA